MSSAPSRQWSMGQKREGAGVRVTLYAGPERRGEPLFYADAATGAEAIALLLPEVAKLEASR